MSDAACRAVLNKKTTTGVVVGRRGDASFRELQLPAPLNGDDVRQVLRNVDKCVIGLTERFEESKQVLQMWYPWLLNIEVDRQLFRIFNATAKENAQSINVNTKAVLEEMNYCDVQMYARMRHRFELQQSVLRDMSFIS